MRRNLGPWILSFVLAASASSGVAGSGVLASATAASGYEIVELVRGAELHGTNGMYFGPDGNLYVASVLGGAVLAVEPDSGRVARHIGSDQGVLTPDDVAFGPDGSLYWTDILVGEVGRLAPDGTVTKQFLALGVNPITFSADGRLFVGLCFLGDGLYELDPELLSPPRAIVVASEENPYPLGFLNAFDFGPDGRLYGPLFAAGLVVSLDVDACTNSSNPWADCDLKVVADGFAWPVAAKFDTNDRLHVLDQSGDVVWIDVATGAATTIATLDPGLDNLAFNDRGDLFVSSADFGWIAHVDPSGEARMLVGGGMVSPQGVAVVAGTQGQDVVFVADHFRMYEFDGGSGENLGIFKGYLVPQPGKLTMPMTLSADGDRLVVSTWFGSVVQVWDPRTDVAIEHYDMPAPLNAIRFQDDLVVADPVLGGVVWASDHGMVLPMDGESVFMPVGLATDGARLWVGDWATGVVWQLDFDGKTAVSTVPVAFDLSYPEGMALDLDGSLLVVETGVRQLSRIDLSTGAVSLVAADLDVGVPATVEGMPPTWFFDGVAVGPSGAIYVSENGRNVVTRIVRR
jgi:sugar lactone lactonase YvrE